MLIITNKYQPYYLYTCIDSSGIPLTLKDSPDVFKTQVVGAIRKVSEWYPTYCVHNIIDEVVSSLWPMYVISGTMTAARVVQDMVLELKQYALTHQPNPQQMCNQLITTIATFNVIDVEIVPITKSFGAIPQMAWPFDDRDSLGLWRICATTLATHNKDTCKQWARGVINRMADLNAPGLLSGLLPLGVGDLYANAIIGQFDHTIHVFFDHIRTAHTRNPDTGPSLDECTCVSLGEGLSHVIDGSTVNALITYWNTKLRHSPLLQYINCLYATTIAEAMIKLPYTLASVSLPMNTSGIRIRLQHAYAGQPSYNAVFKLHKNMKRGACAVLDRLFPPSSEVDGSHMITRLSALVAIASKAHWQTYIPSIPNSGDGVPEDEVCRMFGITPTSKRAKNPITMLRHFERVLNLYPIGTPQNIVITHALTMFDQPEMVRMFECDLIGLSINRLKPYNMQAALKLASMLLRRYNTLPRGHVVNDEVVAKCAYWELSFGRSQFTSDIEAEITNRTTSTWHLRMNDTIDVAVSNGQLNPLVWREAEVAYSDRDGDFYRALQYEIHDIVSSVLPRRACDLTYEQFLATANDWLASGAAPGASVIMQGSPNPVRVGKRGWAEMTPPATIARHLHRHPPQEFAVASEKYENGKSRALYGVEPYHYMHSTFATRGLEERLHRADGIEKGLTGLAEYKTTLKRAAITSKYSSHCCMLDYADFNVQHTPEAQALLFETLRDVGIQRGATTDWIAANTWIAKAKFNMQCRFPGALLPDGTRLGTRNLSVVQGMYSGTRSTDLINTVLNLAYYNIAAKLVRDRYGIIPVGLYHVHQGDDVWISVDNQEWCALLYYTLNNMGLVMQRDKQMFGPHRGEFLRVLYSHGRAHGYLGRALANMVLKEVQKPIPLDAASMIASAQTSIATCVRRGMSLVAAGLLLADTINHFRKVHAFPGDPAPVTIPHEFIWANRTVGGIGMVHPSSTFTMNPFDPKQVNAASFPTIPAYNGTDLDQLPSVCTQQWLAAVSTSFYNKGITSIRSDLLKRASVSANYSEALFSVHKRKLMRYYKRDVRQHITRYSQHLPPINPPSDILVPVIQHTTPQHLSIIDYLYRTSQVNREIIGDSQYIRHAVQYSPTLRAAGTTSMTLHTQIGEDIANHLNHPDNPRDPECIPQYASIINKLIVRSELRSIAKLRSALNLTYAEALHFVVLSQTEKNPSEVIAAEVILQAAKTNPSSVIRALLEHGIGRLESYTYFTSPALCQTASHFATNAILCACSHTTHPLHPYDVAQSIDTITCVIMRHLLVCNSACTLPVLY